MYDRFSTSTLASMALAAATVIHSPREKRFAITYSILSIRQIRSQRGKPLKTGLLSPSANLHVTGNGIELNRRGFNYVAAIGAKTILGALLLRHRR
ncbi:MAG: hypothetical protein KDA42_15260 [Planctomycetales bacterium]|nr:hypothetical protein [Planctomycetales bacterium]